MAPIQSEATATLVSLMCGRAHTVDFTLRSSPRTSRLAINAVGMMATTRAGVGMSHSVLAVFPRLMTDLSVGQHH